MLYIHAETNTVSGTFCYPKGHLGGPFFRESVTNNSENKEYSIEISLHPPGNNGCYFSIYYEDTEPEDKMYLLPTREVESQNQKWKISPLVPIESDMYPLRKDHYVLKQSLNNGIENSKWDLLYFNLTYF